MMCLCWGMPLGQLRWVVALLCTQQPSRLWVPCLALYCVSVDVLRIVITLSSHVVACYVEVLHRSPWTA